MSHITLNQLPDETIKLITSTQIITSVSTAVKELVENSIDANAQNIQVKLENFGFGIVEVKDDGHGISYNNIQRMFLPGYTSKISCFNDLGKLETYGFRGEALAALAKLSTITVTTKTSADSLAMTYTINNEGNPSSSKPSHLAKGTIVTATNLFQNLPVRKQYLSNKKKVSEEMKRVENVVQSLSIIHPELRINLIHNKCPIWQKNSVKGLKQSFMQVAGLKIVSKMEHLNELGNNILVDLIIPKKDLDSVDNLLTNSNQSIFMYVNKRPVSLSKLSKIVMEHIFLHYTHLNPTGKYAVCLLSVEVPPQEIDVNLEPNKTKVFLKNESEVINLVDHMLSSYFGQSISIPETQPAETYEDDDPGKEEDFDERPENQSNKRPRIEKDDPQQVSTLRNKEFVEKNDGWHLEIIGGEDVSQSSPKLSLCSQINSENCTLTTQKELGELKKLLHENNQKLITSVNVDSENRLTDRNKIQVQEFKVCGSKTDESATTSSNEKPILPSWPVREIPEKCKKPEVENITQEISELTNILTNENHLMDVEVLDNIDLTDWSKGTMQTESGLLPGGVTLARPECMGDEIVQKLDTDVEQFDLSVRSVSSQMGKKELSAFTKYARTMRPRVLEEFPGIIFTKVAGLLVDRWKSLPADERKYYEKLSKVVDLKRELHREQKTLDGVPKPSCITRKSKETEKKPIRFEKKITASFETIIQKREIKPDENAAENEVQLIGQLQPSGNWLYRKGTEIGHVRHYGLQELVLFQRMLSNHIVPRQPAPKELLINQDILGEDLWNVLVGLEMEYDPSCSKYIVVSPILSKNGFKVALEKRNNIINLGWITEVASTIPFYGITELKDTLNLYRSKGEFADLASLRSTAVINYITNEVIRIVQQTPRPPDLKDIKEWLEIWQIGLTHLPPQCLHCREIFVPIYHINKDPLKSRLNKS